MANIQASHYPVYKTSGTVTLTTVFQAIELPQGIRTIILTNKETSTATIYWSWGVTLVPGTTPHDTNDIHGELLNGECITMENLDFIADPEKGINKSPKRIYLRGESGSEAFSLIAW